MYVEGKPLPNTALVLAAQSCRYRRKTGAILLEILDFRYACSLSACLDEWAPIKTQTRTMERLYLDMGFIQ